MDRPIAMSTLARTTAGSPDGIEIPIGPVHVEAGEDLYRRVVLLPSEDGHVTEKLRLLERAARGDLDGRTRKLQVGLIEDLARQETEETVEHLVELALAEPAGLTLVGFPGPEQEMFDLSYGWETDAVSVEFVRLAALRALRLIAMDSGGDNVLARLRNRTAGADTGVLRRINVVVAVVLDGTEPPEGHRNPPYCIGLY